MISVTSNSTTAKGQSTSDSVDNFEENGEVDDEGEEEELDVDEDIDDESSSTSSNFRRRNLGGGAIADISRSHFSRGGTPVSLQEGPSISKPRASTLSKTESRKSSTNSGTNSNSTGGGGGGFLRNLSMRFSRRSDS